MMGNPSGSSERSACDPRDDEVAVRPGTSSDRHTFGRGVLSNGDTHGASWSIRPGLLRPGLCAQGLAQISAAPCCPNSRSYFLR